MIDLMACGHTANSTRNGKPFCVICGCDTIAEKRPSLDGRKARCADCGKVKSSSYDLPFFEYCPNKEYDRYYCGCWGWD